MTPRNATGIAAALALLSAAGSAFACGGNPMPAKLGATPALESTLTGTYLAAHHGYRSAHVARIHYGSVMGDWYAVASFAVDGRTAKPTIFVRHHDRGAWHITRQTRGAVCGRYVPVPLIELWNLDRVHHTNCFVEPSPKV